MTVSMEKIALTPLEQRLQKLALDGVEAACEMDDRTSPEGYEEYLLLTPKELQWALEQHGERVIEASVVSLRSQLDAVTAERDEARHELWNLGLAIGQIAKWPRMYFHRAYVEEWVIRTARIIERWNGPKNAIDVLNVTSNYTKPNERLAAEAEAIRARSALGDHNG